MYDLTKFGKVHPGGRQILENFNDTDATDYFYVIHSDKARDMLANLPFTELPEKEKLPQSDYLKMTFQLEKEGWFKPNYGLEVLYHAEIVALMILATVLSNEYPFLAAISLGVGLALGGWIGHACDHSRNTVMKEVSRPFSILTIGISPTWWGAKHTLHHLSTNELDHDSDIQLFPYLYLWKPAKETDIWNRRFQHIYFTVLYSTLQLNWEIVGTIYTFQNRLWGEFLCFVAHWIWYLCVLPWKVWFFGTIFGGTIIGWIVTSSHQAETKLLTKKTDTKGNSFKNKYQIHDMIEHQCNTTINIDSQSWLFNFLSGGLQYQIEHHLFPRMPIHRLPLIRPMIKDYCKKHNIPYIEDSPWNVFKRNYDHIETMAMVKV
jgi:delta8-fatty-acid desaturase